jgi:hypothetical protein
LAVGVSFERSRLSLDGLDRDRAGCWRKLVSPEPTATTGGAVLDPTLDLEQLGQTQVPMCDVVPWSLFGISLAGFNFLFSLLGLGLALLGLRRALKG